MHDSDIDGGTTRKHKEQLDIPSLTEPQNGSDVSDQMHDGDWIGPWIGSWIGSLTGSQNCCGIGTWIRSWIGSPDPQRTTTWIRCVGSDVGRRSDWTSDWILDWVSKWLWAWDLDQVLDRVSQASENHNMDQMCWIGCGTELGFDLGLGLELGLGTVLRSGLG